MPDRELRTGRIVLIVAAIGATVVAAVGAVLWWLDARGMPCGGERLERAYALSVPGPNLQSAPQPDLTAYFAAKRERLHGLAWLDASKGLARIPVEEAMTLIASGAAPPGGGAARPAGPDHPVSPPASSDSTRASAPMPAAAPEPPR